MRLVAVYSLLVLFSLSFAACKRSDEGKSMAASKHECALILARHEGDAPIDLKITQLQQAVLTTQGHTDKKRHQQLEQLGWAFIEKARQSFDAGYYKLAAACALCSETTQPDNLDARLLRGQALNNLHRFNEAEALARSLVASRELHLDYALLGDALMEQGKLDEAITVYQKMMDLKPGPQAYARAAHLRWLKGDLEGAIEMMALTAQASAHESAADAAWAHTRLALYELQVGNTKLALAAIRRALEFQSDYPPALLAQGRTLFNEGAYNQAIAVLKRAAELNPLPEYQWALADALAAADRHSEALAIETAMQQQGPANDPRTFALYLATRSLQKEQAIELSQAELKSRKDVFTLDALAWSLACAGRGEEASQVMRQAIAEGTQDARLFYHAGAIAAMTGEKRAAQTWFNKAAKIKQMLLPSEQKLLSRSIRRLMT